jgi:hypothetical protein
MDVANFASAVYTPVKAASCGWISNNDCNAENYQRSPNQTGKEKKNIGSEILKSLISRESNCVRQRAEEKLTIAILY